MRSENCRVYSVLSHCLQIVFSDIKTWFIFRIFRSFMALEFELCDGFFDYCVLNYKNCEILMESDMFILKVQ